MECAVAFLPVDGTEGGPERRRVRLLLNEPTQDSKYKSDSYNDDLFGNEYVAAKLGVFARLHVRYSPWQCTVRVVGQA